MNIVDACIILLLGLGFVIGFKRGFTKSIAKSAGFVLVIILAFILKNPLSEYMYQNLPFLSFCKYSSEISPYILAFLPEAPVRICILPVSAAIHSLLAAS